MRTRDRCEAKVLVIYGSCSHSRFEVEVLNEYGSITHSVRRKMDKGAEGGSIRGRSVDDVYKGARICVFKPDSFHIWQSSVT